MNSASRIPKSPAAKTSWACLVLAIASTLFFVTCAVGQNGASYVIPPAPSLAHRVASTILSVLLAGKALAVVAGVASFILIRREDITSKAIIGIVARNVCGIVFGLCAGFIVYIVWAHVVIGF